MENIEQNSESGLPPSMGGWEDLAAMSLEEAKSDVVGQSEVEASPEQTQPENAEESERLSLAEIRQLHLDFISGKKEHISDEEAKLFEEDQDFYSSPEYTQYRAQQVIEFARRRPDIYMPQDEQIQRNISPYLEVIREDSETLYKLGSAIEHGADAESAIKNLMEFFASKFGVEDTPVLLLETKSDGEDCGGYNFYHNRLRCVIDKNGSVADIVETIGHEMWHAHQHRANNELYDANNRYYYTASIDYEGYRGQLVEREAFEIGDAISDLFRRKDLEEHPERIPDLEKKYHEWIDNKYFPSKTEDGIDYEYLILAHEMKPKKLSAVTRVFNGFRKRLRKEQNEQKAAS